MVVVNLQIENLEALKQASNFPWLLSNAYDRRTNEGLAHGLRKLVIPWNGYKVGFIGLIEREWLETLSTVSPEQVPPFHFFVVLFGLSFSENTLPFLFLTTGALR